MVIGRDDLEEREARLRALMQRFQEAEKRALIKRGITLWTWAERQSGIRPEAVPPPDKIN